MTLGVAMSMMKNVGEMAGGMAKTDELTLCVVMSMMKNAGEMADGMV